MKPVQTCFVSEEKQCRAKRKEARVQLQGKGSPRLESGTRGCGLERGPRFEATLYADRSGQQPVTEDRFHDKKEFLQCTSVPILP